MAPEPSSRRDARIHRALTAIALALTASTLAAALHDVSTAWDVWWYHMPFAARLWRMFPEDAYVFRELTEARFHGFPLLIEALQGLFWKVTGHPQAANLVALGALGLHALFLRRFFAVPWHLSVIALMAIPLVQLHATSCYIDLPANLAGSALFLLACRIAIDEAPASGRRIALLAALAAFTANARFQLHPLVGLSLLIAAPRVLGPAIRARAIGRLALFALALVLVVATPLKNLIAHGNPYYPVQMTVAGRVLPGVEDVYSSFPTYLEGATRPVRFVFSLLEIGIRPLGDPRRWTLDQWMPPDSTGNRMGGFFGAYVAVNLVVLILTAFRSRARPVRRLALSFLALTALTALLPQSNELRYYMYWMIVLVSLNLAILCRADAAAPLSPAGFGVSCAAALAVVLAVTRCGYVYPSGSTFTELLHDKVDPRALASIREGERVCLTREPWSFLYIAPLHGRGHYSIKEAEEPAGCGDHRWVE